MGTSSIQKKGIPVKEGLFIPGHDPDTPPRLLACRCSECDEIFFPRRSICQNCQAKSLEPMELSSRGKIFSFTVVMQRPPSNYRGPVPFAFGWVELPEGVRIEALYTGCELKDLRIGMDVELVVETLHHDDDGREIVCHKFQPVQDDNSRNNGGAFSP